MLEESKAGVSRRRWRKVGLILVAFLLVLALGLMFFLLRFYRPVGKGPAGPTLDGADFEQVWTDRTILLLGYGDSITAGFGVTPPYGYVARLAENPENEFEEMKGKCLKRVLPNLSVLNVAVSGSTSIQHLQTLDAKIPVQEAGTFGLVVLTTGGNDLIHFYGQTPPREGAMYGATLEEARGWIDHFRVRLNAILDGIEKKFPGGCVIFLADIYDPTDGVGDAASVFLPPWPDGVAILAEYNRILCAASENRPNVFHVPLYDTFLGHGTHCTEPWRKHYCRFDPHFWFSINIEDPNIRGFDATRRIFLREIVKQKQLLVGE